MAADFFEVLGEYFDASFNWSGVRHECGVDDENGLLRTIGYAREPSIPMIPEPAAYLCLVRIDDTARGHFDLLPIGSKRKEFFS
jgi:hypothetical protein